MRRWTRPYRFAHGLLAVGVPVAALTGLMLWLPAWHTALIPALMGIEEAHVLLGALLGALILFPLAVLPRPRLLRRGDWWPGGVLLGATVTSGVALWYQGLVPPAWRAQALGAHGVLAAALVLFWASHGVRRWLLPRLTGRPEPRRGLFRSDRRRFLLLAAASLGGWALAEGIQGALGRAGVRLFARAAPAERGTWTIYTVTGTFPALPPASFRLRIEGAAGGARELTLKDLRRLPRTELTHAFHCVTGWIVRDVRWTGVRLTDLLAAFPPPAEATAFNFYSADGVYTESLTFADARALPALLAYGMEGSDLPREHGGPLRLVVPGMYGYKSIKWVARIAYAALPLVGYWEERGYPEEATIGPTPPAPFNPFG